MGWRRQLRQSGRAEAEAERSMVASVATIAAAARSAAAAASKGEVFNLDVIPRYSLKPAAERNALAWRRLFAKRWLETRAWQQLARLQAFVRILATMRMLAAQLQRFEPEVAFAARFLMRHVKPAGGIDEAVARRALMHLSPCTVVRSLHAQVMLYFATVMRNVYAEIDGLYRTPAPRAKKPAARAPVKWTADETEEIKRMRGIESIAYRRLRAHLDAGFDADLKGAMREVMGHVCLEEMLTRLESAPPVAVSVRVRCVHLLFGAFRKHNDALFGMFSAPNV